MTRGIRALWLGWLLAICLPAEVGATGCAAVVQATMAAPETRSGERPDDGWIDVQLPDTWTFRWPEPTDGALAATWYRIDWQRRCDGDDAEPLGLGLDSITMAGSIHVNDELLWRDASLVEPLPLGWNQPRWWPLPASMLQPGHNTLWIRVVSPPQLAGGLGALRIGAATDVEAMHAHLQWRQRTAYVAAASLSGAVGCIFLVMWLLRRREQAFGWYALMTLAWVLYLATLLATHPWPWPFDSALAMSRLNLCALSLYVMSFCLFTFRFGAQQLPRVERALLWLTALSIGAMLLVPASLLMPTSLAVLLISASLFFLNCVQFQWHAWRRRKDSGRRQHRLLALCWLSFLLVGLHDLAVVLRLWETQEAWTPLTSPLATAFMALLLGSRLTSAMSHIERFNHELEDRVAQARTELAEVLAREHAQAIAHATLHERVQLAHDLHDGLGASLVRGMALVEQSRRTQQPLSSDGILSILKLLRDDLRQLIDHGSSTGAVVPETPLLWLAPLRHRFTRILDALEITSTWDFDEHWSAAPSALQCLGLMRILEEALSNVIKHSQARQVRVHATQSANGLLVVGIEDDGVGFDVQATRGAGLSVGLRSMAARAARLGGRFEAESDPRGTRIGVAIAVASTATTSVAIAAADVVGGGAARCAETAPGPARHAETAA